MTKEQINYKTLYILIAILVFIDVTFIIGYGISAYIITRPTEINGKIECNSGKINIDYKSNYSTNLSEFIPSKLDIQGIDNMNCKAEFASKGSMSTMLNYMIGEISNEN
jgi:hypothetical protein